MPQNGIIGVHGIQNDQKLQKMEHYFKMHHLILCPSEGVNQNFFQKFSFLFVYLQSEAYLNAWLLEGI